MAATVSVSIRTDVSCISLTFTGWAGVNTLTVERRASGERYTPARSGLEFDLEADGSGTLDDFEAPMDVALTYRITQSDPASTAEPTTVGPYTLASLGWSWLKDPALPWRNVRLDEVGSVETETFASRAGVFDVIDRARPIVVAARRQDRTTDLVLTTATEAQRQGMLNILSSGQILLLATPQAYGWGNDYIHIGDAVQSRLGTAAEASRRWQLPLTVVDRPVSLSYRPAQMTWGDVVADYATWSDLIDDNLTWGELISGIPQ